MQNVIFYKQITYFLKEHEKINTVIKMYANRLKALRERIGLTQTQVGSLIGIKRSQYCLYEKEKVTIPSKHLNTLCNYYKVSLDYIFEFTDTKRYKINNE